MNPLELNAISIEKPKITITLRYEIEGKHRKSDRVSVVYHIRNSNDSEKIVSFSTWKTKCYNKFLPKNITVHFTWEMGYIK